MKLSKLRTEIKKGGDVYVFVPISFTSTDALGGTYAQIIKTTLLKGLNDIPDGTEFDVKIDEGCVYIGKPRLPKTT